MYCENENCIFKKIEIYKSEKIILPFGMMNYNLKFSRIMMTIQTKKYAISNNIKIINEFIK